MNYPTVFHLIASEFKKAKIPCVLIGGFAINFYKVTRHTADVDFFIQEEDFNKVLFILKKAGYRQEIHSHLFARFQGDGDIIDLDFLFVDPNTLRRILKEGKQVKIANQKFTIPSLFHLIALKLHSIKCDPKREQRDLSDIFELIRLNDLEIGSVKFKKLCLQYGSRRLYDKIMSQ